MLIFNSISKRYLFAGITTKLFDFVAFSSIFSISNNVIIANTIALLCSLTINFCLHFFFTYESKVKNLPQYLSRYLIINLALFAVDTIAIFLMISEIKLYPSFAKTVSTLTLSFLAYIATDRYIFK